MSEQAVLRVTLTWTDYEDQDANDMDELDLSHLVGQWDIDRFKRFVADTYAVHGYDFLELRFRNRGEGLNQVVTYRFIPSFTPEVLRHHDIHLEQPDPMWSCVTTDL